MNAWIRVAKLTDKLLGELNSTHNDKLGLVHMLLELQWKPRLAHLKTEIEVRPKSRTKVCKSLKNHLIYNKWNSRYSLNNVPPIPSEFIQPNTTAADSSHFTTKRRGFQRNVAFGCNDSQVETVHCWEPLLHSWTSIFMILNTQGAIVFFLFMIALKNLLLKWLW